MMTMLAAADLAAMVAVQTASFWDTCVIQTYSATRDNSGQPVNSPSDGSAIACRLYPTGSNERRGMQSPVMTDATLRLPLGTTITPKDRVKVTYRYGVVLSVPEVFEVVSDPAPMRGPTAMTVYLRKVKP